MKLSNKLKYISISSRISILLGVIILLTMGTFSVFSLIKLKQDSIGSINNNTEQLSQTIEKILRLSMLKNRRDEISIAVNSIVDTAGIKSVRILNHQGIIKYSSVATELNKNISQQNPLCISCHSNDGNKSKADLKDFNHSRIDEVNNLIFNSLPIYNDAGCSDRVCHSSEDGVITIKEEKIQNNLSNFSFHDPSQRILGFIEIEVSLKKITTEIKNTRWQLILLTILFAFLASLTTYFSIRKVVGKPVKNLVDGTRRVAEGDFNNEIPPSTAELGLLAESFNKMQKQLLITQSQLIESEKLSFVGKLSNEIANEINNPLTGIIIYSESLLDDPNLSDGKKDIKLIQQEALKIRESIRNILSLTKYEKPIFRPIDLNGLIVRTISVVEKFSNFRNIKIIAQTIKTLPNISADAGLIEQVFLNLFLLLAESLPTGGVINVAAYLSNNNIEISLRDTGKGIFSDTLKKIFLSDKALNLDNFEKSELSLAVCKNIIEMHKGRINFSSTDVGNSIKIILPITENEQKI